MSQTLSQLRLEICERQMIALQYYDEAQQIQRHCRLLPTTERRAAMDEVYEMQARAVSEPERITDLERKLAMLELTERDECQAVQKLATTVAA